MWGLFVKAPTPPKLFGSRVCLIVWESLCPVPKFWAKIGVVCTLTVESADSSQAPPRPCLLTNVSFMKKCAPSFVGARVCANMVRREIRLMLRISRPSGFTRSLRSHVQDDRGGMFYNFSIYGYYKTILLSVILSVRSPRSFLQSNEVSSKKSSRLRRRDLRTVTDSNPLANELFPVHKRQKRTRVCANILRREIRPCFASVALRAS